MKPNRVWVALSYGGKPEGVSWSESELERVVGNLQLKREIVEYKRVSPKPEHVPPQDAPSAAKPLCDNYVPSILDGPWKGCEYCAVKKPKRRVKR